MTIELNEYGLMIDLGDFLYVSLSWAFIISSALILVGYKVYKVMTKRRTLGNCLQVSDTNELWGN